MQGFRMEAFLVIAERMMRIRNNLSPRQRHMQKLVQMEAEYKTATGFRKKDLRKGIKRMIRELRTYDRYTNRDGWVR